MGDTDPAIRIGRGNVVVVVPTLDEAEHIQDLVESLLQDPLFSRPGLVRLWVLDGGSQDGTQEQVRRLAERFNVVELIDNPGRTQAQGVNLAAERAAALGVEYLVRIDAHGGYPQRFISGLLDVMEAQNADSVVVPMRTVGGGPMRDAAADLYNSWLGNGGSPHRSGNVRGWVEHGHHAAFKLAAYRAVGGYDPRFEANEDAEFDKRMVKIGARIFLESALVMDYVPRDSFPGFWRQMSRNGRYRVWTAVKHSERLGPRQLLPVAVTVSVVGSVLAAAFWWPLGLPVLAYLLLVLILSIRAARVVTAGRVGRIAGLAVVSHLGFGIGAIQGLAEAGTLKRVLRTAPATSVEMSR